MKQYMYPKLFLTVVLALMLQGCKRSVDARSQDWLSHAGEISEKWQVEEDQPDGAALKILSGEKHHSYP